MDAATVSCEYGTTIYMTPTANQACVVDVFKNERDDDGWITDSVHDYYQLPYAEIPLRIEHHMAGAIGGGDLLPFVSEVNNVQLEEWFRENSVDAYSRQNFGLAHGSPKIDSKASEIQLEE
ncbi:hypothetical protein DV707_10915 [Halobellus limi]|uniref:Uncharacterized protein n=2 Tax=Halobellus limi TaxID=699433 RepID=A0A1H5ZF91_9EURY|nr:hypothetical protein DV707_10915 [Halobellus limi]SEG34395.1 hypothetical protein SAMN04488133_1953 [Halobellus limi]